MTRAISAMPYILCYHSVADRAADPFRITVSPARFERQMEWLRRRRLRGVSMRELLAAYSGGHPAGTARLVGLTFDDGYTDFATTVVPVLARHGFTATVFVVADRIGGHNQWDPGGPRKDLMSAEQIRRVAGLGMEVASHSLTHPSLPGVPQESLEHELVKSRAVLSDLIGGDVTGFCYPYGHVAEREVNAVREAGYGYACAVRRPTRAGRHSLPRTYIGEEDGPLRMDAKRLRHRLRWGRGR